MPRILHIIDSLDHTGIATQMLLLARGLTSRSFDVHIAVLNASPKTRWPIGAHDLPIINIGRRWVIDPLADLRLVRHVAELQPDIVHTWNTVPGMLGPIAAGLIRHLRGGWRREAPRPPWSGQPPVSPRLIAGLYCVGHYQPAWDAHWARQFTRRAERIVTNSTAVRNWFCARPIATEELTVIPSGVPPALLSDVSREQLLLELKLPPDARLIGVIGRLVPEKRVQDLIWAADLLRVLHDNLRMLIVGDGPLRSALEQYARMASDLDHIHFLGERDDVWRILPHLDVLWNGSDSRRVSIAMLEAMSAGVPIVASDVPVNRELVSHGETGYLIPIGRRSGRADRARCTDRIFADSTVSARLGAAALQQAKTKFSLDSMVQRHMQEYGFSNSMSRSRQY